MNLSELPVLQKVLDHKVIHSNRNSIRLTDVTIDIALPDSVDLKSDKLELWLKDASGQLIKITGTHSPLPEKDQEIFEFQRRNKTWEVD
jgi:hypothetical protein